MIISKAKLFDILNKECRKNKATYEELTAREREIIKLLVNGNNSEAISNQLGIAKNTVATHRKNIIKKTKLKSPKEIIFFALAFDML